jgi:hypothetical protein
VSKSLDWLIAAIVLALGLMAEYRLVFTGEYEPFGLAGAVSLLLVARVACQQVPRLMPKAPRRVSRKK